MRNRFVDTVVAKGGDGADLMFISGDAGLGVFDRLREQTPGSFLNLGVAEQNMASFAAGLALTGCKVYLYNIIPFLLYRCYEQIRNDICYQKLPVVLVGIGSGVTYAPAGISHYAVEDLGLAATLPNLTVISPGDPLEAQAAAEFSLTSSAPVYVRLAKSGGTTLHTAPPVDLTRPQLLEAGGDCALLFHGSIADDAAHAARLLREQGVAVTLVSLPLLQPLNTSALLEMLANQRLVVSVEEHYPHVGLGGILAQLQTASRPPWQLRSLGIPYRFIHDVNHCSGLRRRYGIDAHGIATAITGWLHEL